MRPSLVFLMIVVLGACFADSQVMLASQDTQYYVCTYVNPMDIGGGFYLGGTFYVDGQVAPIKVDKTNYTITAREIPGYAFSHWSTTRSVIVYDTGSPSTVASFDSSGWDEVCVGGLGLWYRAMNTTASNSTAGTTQSFSRTLSDTITPSATVSSTQTFVLDPQTQFLLGLFATVAVTVFMAMLGAVHKVGKSLRDSCKVAILAAVAAIFILFIPVGPLSQFTIPILRALPFVSPWFALPAIILVIVCVVGIIRIMQHAKPVRALTAAPAQVTPEKAALEPRLNVEIYEDIQVPEQGSPSQRIYFKVTNVGKSTAPNCRGVLTVLPVKPLPTLPPSFHIPIAYETTTYLLGHIELDWFNAGLFKPDERCLGKSVSIPAHRNSIFLAGTILAEKVELGSVHKVSAALTITVNTPEDHPPKGTLTRPLLELYDGGSLELDLVFSWERDYAQEQTFRYQLQVKSFDEICFTQIR